MKNTNAAEVLPNLIAELHSRLADSPRAQYYAGLSELAVSLDARYQSLKPTAEEIALTADLDAKRSLEDKIERYLERYVEPVRRIAEGGDTPEWLLPRHKKTMDFYTAVFAGIDALADGTKAQLDTVAPADMQVAVMKDIYSQWRAIYDAQQGKAELMIRVSELVDIKQAIIGALRLLDVAPQRVSQLSQGLVAAA